MSGNKPTRCGAKLDQATIIWDASKVPEPRVHTFLSPSISGRVVEALEDLVIRLLLPQHAMVKAALPEEVHREGEEYGGKDHWPHQEAPKSWLPKGGLVSPCLQALAVSEDHLLSLSDLRGRALHPPMALRPSAFQISKTLAKQCAAMRSNAKQKAKVMRKQLFSQSSRLRRFRPCSASALLADSQMLGARPQPLPAAGAGSCNRPGCSTQLGPQSIAEMHQASRAIY